MHETHTGRNCVARIEVISHSTAHVHSKREVLSLRILHPFGSLSVNIPEAKACIKVGHGPRVTRDEITSNTHDVREIPALRSPRNRGNRSAERKIPIAAQNTRTSYVVHMPSERSSDGYEGVFKGICVVDIAYENVKRKGGY